MKNAFLLLVLANLGFLAWHYWFAERPPPVGPVASEQAPRLALPEQTADAVLDSPAFGQSYSCVSLGPFLDIDEARRARIQLELNGYAPEGRTVETTIGTRKWVYLPPFPSRERARVVMNELREQDVGDLYVEPSGEYRNAISLGLFSNPNLARTRSEQIRRLGYEPRIIDLARTNTLFWLDFQLNTGQLVKATEFQTAPDRILRLEPRECTDDAQLRID